MGDEASTIARPLPSHLFEHYCEEPGCKVWGMLGYEPVKGQNSFWCWDHFPDQEWVEERRASRRAQAGQ